jgi:5-methylcytosine-specific restriction protein A
MARAWDHGGKSAAQRGYGRQHRKLREQLLRQEPLCRLCKQKDPTRVSVATIADHVVPIAKGGAIHEINNLQPVCAECHQDKSNLDKGHRVKRRISLSGWPV